MKKVIPYVDFLVPSAEELCFMIDRPRFDEWQSRADGRDVIEVLDIEKDIKPLADQCMSYGAKVLIIKCGALGMYYRTASAEKMEQLIDEVGLDLDTWAGQEGFESSFVPDKIVSGTGAGDTSIAAFLTAMISGKTLRESMQLAAATGACCVSSVDALGGLKTFDELEQKIQAGWKKNDM